MKNSILQDIIKAAGKDKGVPVSTLTSDLNLASVVSKMVHDPMADSRRRHNQRMGPDVTTLRRIAGETASKVSDARGFLQLLPDLKLGIEILISSTLSPKDMLETSVTFHSDTDTLPSSVLANLNGIAEEYFSKDYKIKPLLPKILWDVLIETGSYPIAVLPENAIDDLINNSTNLAAESFQFMQKEDPLRPLGILGKPGKPKPSSLNFSFESFQSSQVLNKDEQLIYVRDNNPNNRTHLFINVTDNPNILKMPKIEYTLAQQKQLEILGYGKALESHSVYFNREEEVGKTAEFQGQYNFYREAKHEMKPLAVARTQEQLKRRSAGNALKLHLPSCSVIPVFAAGEVDKHLGYFVVIDETGNPLNLQEGVDYYGQLKASMNNTKDNQSSLVQRMTAQFDLNGSNTGRDLDILINSYTDMIEMDLNERLKNGMVKGEVKIANRDALMQLMLTRTLRQQYTQVLYLPRELLNYIAIDFNDYGIGRSLMDDMRVICGLRVVSMFANMMASIKNSIGRTEVAVKFDEFDADPWNTLETIMGELNRTRTGITGNLPIGASGPAEVVDWLTKAGYEFTFEGHPSMPDVNIDFGESNTNYTKPDTDMEDDLRKRTSMAISVPPELIDNAFGPDFATVAVHNNLLLSKRVMQIQDALIPPVSEHCRSVMINDEPLMRKMRKLITDSIDEIKDRLINKEEVEYLTRDTKITQTLLDSLVEFVLKDYLESFTIKLPRPNSVELENQLAAFETYNKALEESLNQLFDDAFANSDTMGELGDKLEIVKSSVKAMYLREWMAENNFMTELFELITEDEAGHINRDIYEEVSEHIAKLTKATARFVKSIKPMKDAADTWANEEGVEETENESSSDDSNNDTGGGDDFGGGDDDFDFGDTDTDIESESDTEDTGDTGGGEASDSGDTGEDTGGTEE